jgi:hypothetical protein
MNPINATDAISAENAGASANGGGHRSLAGDAVEVSGHSRTGGCSELPSITPSAADLCAGKTTDTDLSERQPTLITETEQAATARIPAGSAFSILRA